jgi:insulysin
MLQIRKPDVDNRAYKYLTLPNKLSVLLISDPDTDKASAALDVHVGHLLDPPEAAGLAHFCEHLLFMVVLKLAESSKHCIEPLS